MTKTISRRLKHFPTGSKRSDKHSGWFLLFSLSPSFEFFYFTPAAQTKEQTGNMHNVRVAQWWRGAGQSRPWGQACKPRIRPPFKTAADIRQTLLCTHPALTFKLHLHHCCAVYTHLQIPRVCSWSSCVISHWAELCCNVGGHIMGTAKRGEKKHSAQICSSACTNDNDILEGSFRGTGSLLQAGSYV